MANEKILLVILFLLAGTIFTQYRLIQSFNFSKVGSEIIHELFETSEEGQKSIPNQKTVVEEDPSQDNKSENPQSQMLSLYIYPLSRLLTSSHTRLLLQSKDDPQVITQWYRNTLSDAGLKSIISTNLTINGIVTNQVSGRGVRDEIVVEITKSAGVEDVYITVTKNPIDNR